MNYLIGIILTIIALMISVALHELGHMIPAKKFGVYVPQYMVGFGPTIYSKQVGDTEYGVKAILLGGYVRLAGMFGPAPEGTPLVNRKGQITYAEEARQASLAELPPGKEHQAFYKLSVPKKLTVMLGGPVVNLLMSIVIFAVIIMGFGINTPTTTLANVPQCIGTQSNSCTEDAPASPAYEAGLRGGDTVVAWNGVQTNSWDDVVAAINEAGTESVPVAVERDGQVKNFEVAAVDFDGRPVAGIQSQIAPVRGGIDDVASISWQTFAGTAKIILALPQAVWNVGEQLFTDQPRDPNSVLSIVGVGRIAGEVSSQGDGITITDRAIMLLSLWASLNMALFVFNLIPLPPLDGGHVAGAIWEGLRRTFNRVTGRPDPGPADTARLVPLTQVVFVLLLAMTILLIAADIFDPISLL
ncbi:MAG: M50 family metallopeptidase [Actinomycetaceae bacterium]|nr:M50 family metallopeptidase [Actinomycetaceae bacterium]